VRVRLEQRPGYGARQIGARQTRIQRQPERPGRASARLPRLDGGLLALEPSERHLGRALHGGEQGRGVGRRRPARTGTGGHAHREVLSQRPAHEGVQFEGRRAPVAGGGLEVDGRVRACQRQPDRVGRAACPGPHARGHQQADALQLVGRLALDGAHLVQPQQVQRVPGCVLAHVTDLEPLARARGVHAEAGA